MSTPNLPKRYDWPGEGPSTIDILRSELEESKSIGADEGVDPEVRALTAVRIERIIRANPSAYEKLQEQLEQEQAARMDTEVAHDFPQAQ